VTPAELAVIAARGHADARELSALLDALGADTKAVQRGAAEAVAALARAGQDVEGLLAAALADPSPRRRWGAAYAWSRLGRGPAACLPVLLDALGADDGDLRWASATILREHGGVLPVAAALRALVASPNPLQRKMALYSLRDLNVRGADVEGAVRASLADPDAGVRLAAMSALATLADDRAAAADALLLRLDDLDPGVRRAAAAALGRLGVASPGVTGALRRALASGDAGLARAAAGALATLGAA